MDLSQLPRENGFRLRGQQVTRLETFVDAAFAFALTLLVIAGDNLPDSFAELREALRRTPVFVLCFVLIAMFWSAHNRWSRRFGLDDTPSTVLSMALVLAVLVYVYPLRMVVASGLYVMSGGFVPADLVIDGDNVNFDLQTAFIIYGAGFCALSIILLLLNLHALRRGDALGLDALERHETGTEIGIQALLTGTALLSIVSSLLLLTVFSDHRGAGVAGLPMYLYMLLGGLIPLYVNRRERRRPVLPAEAGT
ncbi:TMEM175 family protein [Arenimonas sp. MALMAid1274]|uniref:TMEM175 family protein n=1 Tax=Arenimonas sp. MALMAid1274 TaxID=3411630 RepID=UPI003B9F0C2F